MLSRPNYINANYISHHYFLNLGKENEKYLYLIPTIGLPILEDFKWTK